jgi:carbon-monoxide dehydrogenase medium subunit
LDEALELLSRCGGDVKLLAGGTALMIMLRAGLIDPEGLVWTGRLPGLDQIDVIGPDVRIGARVTLRELERSATANAVVPVLASTASLVANPRVRNVATVGGNLSEADYASDPPCVLHALRARVELRSSHALRTVRVEDFLLDYYETVLEPDEMVTAVEIPMPRPSAAWVYLKFQTRSVEDRPCLGVCALAEFADDGTCEDLRVSVGAAASVPFRVPDAEALVRGVSLDDAELVAEVAEMYARSREPLGDLRGSSAYRARMIGVLVRRALEDLSTRKRQAVRV